VAPTFFAYQAGATFAAVIYALAVDTALVRCTAVSFAAGIVWTTAIAVINSAFIVAAFFRLWITAGPVTAGIIFRAGITPSITTFLGSPIVTSPIINPITASHIRFAAALYAPVVYTAFTFIRFAINVIAFARTTSLTCSTLVRIICAITAPTPLTAAAVGPICIINANLINTVLAITTRRWNAATYCRRRQYI